MTNSLFRQEALDEQKDRLYGEVIITQPPSFRVVSIGLLLVVICVLLILVYGNYARKERVVGYLVPDKGLVKIYAPLQGILTKTHIKEGQKVSKGDILFSVSTLQSNEKGSDKGALLLTELEQQKATINLKVSQEESLHQAKMQMTESQIFAAQQETQQLESSIELQEEQLSLISAQKKNFGELFRKGHVAESQVKEIEQNYLNAKVSLQSSRRELIQLKNRSQQLIQQKKQMPLEWQVRLADYQQNLSNLEQRIVETAGQRMYSIRSPIDGHLTALQVAKGQTLNSQSPIIAILPEGAKMNAELFLPTRAAGFISPGKSVFLRYGAFPYQHYGLQQGRVKYVAQVILAPNELPIPVQLNEPVYRVKVELDKQTVEAFGKEFSLQAGMLLDADIIIEKRSLGQWLLQPIYSLRGKL